jgi:hypothetical protein
LILALRDRGDLIVRIQFAARREQTKKIDVLLEVNGGCKTNSLPELVLVGAWNPGSTSRLEHILERSFNISPFRLHHLWIDLRS